MKYILLIAMLSYHISVYCNNDDNQRDIVVRILNNAKEPNRDPYSLIPVDQKKDEVFFSGCTENGTTECMNKLFDEKEKRENAMTTTQSTSESIPVVQTSTVKNGCSIYQSNDSSLFTLLLFVLVLSLKMIKRKKNG